MPLILLLAAAIVAFTGTRVVRGYARRRAILDVPNSRSLHERPVPRGGGLAIVATFLLGTAALTLLGAVPASVATALIGGGAAVALIGWLDDRNGVRPAVRAVIHLAAAAWALWWLGGLDRVWFGGPELYLPLAGQLLVIVAIVWWINLFNFMDGIDGLAGGQALTVAAAAGFLALTAYADRSTAMLAFLLAGAAAGFVVLNWSPARVFMGDVGSGFLGFVFAVLAIATERTASLPLVVWLLLSAVFLFDSTITLVRRIAHGERWHEAHRSHAYQRLVTSGYSHAVVATGVLLLNGLLAAAALYVVRGGSLAVATAGALLLLAGVYAWAERRQPMWPRVESGTDAAQHELTGSRPRV